MNRGILIIFLLGFFCSCSTNSVPDNVLKPAVMKEVMWDYIKAESLTTEFIGKDSLKNLSFENVRLQKSIFLKHNVSRETFYRSYLYYQNHPNLMQVMLDSMIIQKRRAHDFDRLAPTKKILPD